MTQRILFVCLGNICRSPTAEAVLRAKAADRGVELTIDSAGTADWHVGKPPYGPMQEAAQARGYDLSPLRARQVTRADLSDFDDVIAMDPENLGGINRLGEGSAHVFVFTDVLNSAEDHVPDPYFTGDFDGALDLIERCADALLGQYIAKQRPLPE